jgi:hypothetical protein
MNNAWALKMARDAALQGIDGIGKAFEHVVTLDDRNDLAAQLRGVAGWDVFAHENLFAAKLITYLDQ